MFLHHFDVHGSVHRKYISKYIQQDATLHSFLYMKITLHVSGVTSTHHQEYIQLYLRHLVLVTRTATCCYRGGVGTGWSVLWVA
jgi:hypothetical protein